MSKSIISVLEKIVLQHSSIIEGTSIHGGLENGSEIFDLSPKDLAALPALSFDHDCGYASTLRSGHDKRGGRRTLE